jgi:hypothetical protein
MPDTNAQLVKKISKEAQKDNFFSADIIGVNEISGQVYARIRGSGNSISAKVLDHVNMLSFKTSKTCLVIRDASGSWFCLGSYSETAAKFNSQVLVEASMLHGTSTVTAGNGLSGLYFFEVPGQEEGGCWLQHGGNQNDSFYNTCYLDSGTYDFKVLGLTDANSGQITWYLDGDLLVSAQDWYSLNQCTNVIQTVANVAILNPGYHTISAIVLDKYPGSTGYDICLTKFWFERL